jgi:outer membrane protein assembly factor BamE (lipoprotein component of BamABCDE complex)
MTARRRLSAPWRRLAAVAMAAAIVGCASPDFVQPGAQRDAVAQRLGAPLSRAPLADGGERWVYSSQPSGRTAHHLDFDAQGRLRDVQQVLTPQRLQSIEVDRWTADQLRATFGPPAMQERVALFDGQVWTYRFYEDFTPRFAHLYVDRAGIVRRMMFADELPRGDDARL